MKKIILTLLTHSLLSFSASAAINEQLPKNIIMIVGDGMGPAYTSAYRYFNDNPKTPEIEPTVFDDILVGNASTYPARVSGLVTDSAAAGTALASGYKSYNGAIGVDVNQKSLHSVMAYAKSIGKATGLVVTSQINHATPASYIAHAKNRKMYNEIANQYFDNKINGEPTADIMMGGGTQYFKREDRNLINEFKAAGYQYINNYDQLTTLKSDKVLGLFGDIALPWVLDDKPNRLKHMTKAAINRLENNKNGFFMLIEGSQIDWGGHANDVATAMTELEDLASTVSWLKTYVDNNPNTLVIITADHSTGGFTIGANGDYAWHPEFIRHLKSSPQIIAKQQATTNFDAKFISQQLGFHLTELEIEALKVIHPLGETQLYTAIKKLIDKRTNTGWTTSGHTGVDVPIFAFGKNYQLFSGQMDNTNIAHKIFKLLGK